MVTKYNVMFITSMALAVLLMSTTTFAATVGLWHFDEGSGTTAYDSSGNGNDATLGDGTTGMPDWVSPGYGGSGSALDFEASDIDYVVAPNSTSLTMAGASEFTVQCWIKPESWTHNHRIVEKNGYGLWSVIVDGNNVMRVQLFFAEDITYYWFYTNGTIPMNEWTHVALAYDGFDIRVWLNGSEDTVVNYPGKTLRDIVADLMIGNRTAGDRPFDGIIDEVQVDNTDLFAPGPADCAEVWGRGLGMAGDLNQDCYVNTLDLEEFVEAWLECNDPNDPYCPTN